MSVADAVIIGNVVLAFLSGLVNTWAIRGAPKSLAYVRAGVAALAFFYSVAYAYLLVDIDGRVLRWSEFMRGVSLWVWPIVWMGPAWASKFWAKRFVAKLEGEVSAGEDGPTDS
jgi:hypothetical protein